MGSLIEKLLDLLDTYIPGFESFHLWFNGLLDKQLAFYIVFPVFILVCIYFYLKFSRENP